MHYHYSAVNQAPIADRSGNTLSPHMLSAIRDRAPGAQLVLINLPDFENGRPKLHQDSPYMGPRQYFPIEWNQTIERYRSKAHFSIVDTFCDTAVNHAEMASNDGYFTALGHAEVARSIVNSLEWPDQNAPTCRAFTV